MLHPVDIKAFLKADANDIIIKATNDTGPAGLLLTGTVTYNNGSTETFQTDGSWGAAKLEDLKGTGTQFVDAKVLGEFGMRPWGRPGGPRENGPAPYLRREFTVGSSVQKAPTLCLSPRTVQGLY